MKPIQVITCANCCTEDSELLSHFQPLIEELLPATHCSMRALWRRDETAESRPRFELYFFEDGCPKTIGIFGLDLLEREKSVRNKAEFIELFRRPHRRGIGTLEYLHRVAHGKGQFTDADGDLEPIWRDLHALRALNYIGHVEPSFRLDAQTKCEVLTRVKARDLREAGESVLAQAGLINRHGPR